MINESKFVTTIPFSKLFNWSVQYLYETKIRFNTSYPMVRIGEFLKRNKTVIDIQGDMRYTRVTIRVRNGGVTIRDTEIGKNIGTKRQFVVSEGQFILSKIDARNGAMGIIPAELDGAIVTQDFLPYDVDTAKINPQYLVLVSTTTEFVAFCQTCSSGTTNRQRIEESKFLDIKIPLPSLAEQNALVAAYNDRIATANNQELEANIFEQQIETYLLAQLGIKIKDVSAHNSILQLFQFSEMIDRWDLLTIQNSIFDALKKSKYPICEIGKVYDFISRGWKPNKNSDRTFKYVEIGAVDALTGITKASTISERRAPSRATQIIKAGDLIIGTTRPYLKKFAIVDSEYNNNICSSGFQIINSKENNLEFLFEYLRSDAGILQFKFYMTGALYPAITSKDLKKIKIPLPPLEVQNEIVAHITGFKKQIKQLRIAAATNRTTALSDFEQKIFK